MIRTGSAEQREGSAVARVSPQATKRALDWSFVRRALTRSLLPIWFSVDAVLTLRQFVADDLLGIDIRIYRQAAVYALAGDNPWAIQPTGLAFAGPPPTLLMYVATALMPLAIATILLIGLGLIAATWTVRRLRLPLWWLLFPPLFGALIVGNPDALILPLLLCTGRVSGLAAVLKVYSAVPLLLQRRWGSLLFAATASLLSLPLLPAFLANAGTVQQTLDEGTAHLSAWGTWLVPPVVVALLFLRRRGAEWLVVPGLWPNTQNHYAAMSLAVVHKYPVAAVLMGLNVPLAPPIGIIAIALQARLETNREAGDQTGRHASALPETAGIADGSIPDVAGDSIQPCHGA